MSNNYGYYSGQTIIEKQTPSDSILSEHRGYGTFCHRNQSIQKMCLLRWTFQGLSCRINCILCQIHPHLSTQHHYNLGILMAVGDFLCTISLQLVDHHHWFLLFRTTMAFFFFRNAFDRVTFPCLALFCSCFLFSSCSFSFLLFSWQVLPSFNLVAASSQHFKFFVSPLNLLPIFLFFLSPIIYQPIQVQ